MSYLDRYTRCQTCAIRHESVCRALNDEEIKALNRISHKRLVKEGQLIVNEGEGQGIFANIVTGVVKLTKTLEDGRQHIIGLLFPSDFLGRAYRKDNPYLAQAVTDVELCMFPATAFERLLRGNPALEHRLFEMTLSELDACQEWMLLLARKKAEERVASLLLMIAKRVPDMGYEQQEQSKEVRFLLPLSRSDIADCLGLTIETVSRQMTRLKNRGVIHLLSNREILVPDVQKLKVAAYADVDV